ncbi:hypothetical protein PI125_g19299 [Phytophthora idaei]|nr:hypothetical protein PI125_g19299 [Phytophthora idaei]KAG3131386.1 hypothetical protein PI126_g20081 [Phytophthora idaei]
MLADTGAIASLVDKRVLKRLGRVSESLRPYTGSLDSVSGHEIRVSGVFDPPMTLGTLERTLPFVVADHLFVDAILGTDSLRAFRAVIDVEGNRRCDPVRRDESGGDLRGLGKLVSAPGTRSSGAGALERTWNGKEPFGCAGRRCSRIGRVIGNRENALYGRGWNGVSGSLQRFH